MGQRTHARTHAPAKAKSEGAQAGQPRGGTVLGTSTTPHVSPKVHPTPTLLPPPHASDHTTPCPLRYATCNQRYSPHFALYFRLLCAASHKCSHSQQEGSRAGGKIGPVERQPVPPSGLGLDWSRCVHAFMHKARHAQAAPPPPLGIVSSSP